MWVYVRWLNVFSSSFSSLSTSFLFSSPDLLEFESYSALSSCLPYTVSSPLWGDKTKMSSTSEPSDPFFCSLSDFTGGTPPARSNYCGSPEDAFPTDPKGCQGSNFFFFFPSSCSSAILTVIMLYSFKWFHGRRPCSSPRLEVFLGGGTSVNIFNLKEKTQPPLFSGVTAIEV